jgi:FKBP-type peptidyl-prolyl cis-trans isomerase FkpA
MKELTMLHVRISCIVLGSLLAACNANKPEAVEPAAQHKKEAPVIKNEAQQDLQIVELKAAPAGAPKPKPGQTVVVHYTGTLAANGKKFDSSKDRNEPFSFPVGMGYVIKGWDEGLQQMAKGGTYKLTIPAHKGYGSRGAGASIPPHADLVFEIEVLDIKN